SSGQQRSSWRSAILAGLGKGQLGHHPPYFAVDESPRVVSNPRASVKSRARGTASASTVQHFECLYQARVHAVERGRHLRDLVLPLDLQRRQVDFALADDVGVV